MSFFARKTFFVNDSSIFIHNWESFCWKFTKNGPKFVEPHTSWPHSSILMKLWDFSPYVVIKTSSTLSTSAVDLWVWPSKYTAQWSFGWCKRTPVGKSKLSCPYLNWAGKYLHSSISEIGGQVNKRWWVRILPRSFFIFFRIFPKL